MQVLLTAVVLFALRAVSAGPVPRADSPPLKDIIFDTDFLSYPDDVGAIALGNAFVQQKKARILGIAINTNSTYSIPAIDAINTYYGHPNAYFGQTNDVHDNLVEPNTPPLPPPTSYPVFIDKLADKTKFNHSSGEPNKTTPLDFYTRLLTNADPKSVTIIAIGLLNNLNDFHESGDAAKKLIKEKVAELVVQGANFSPNIKNGTDLGPHHAGFNLDTDIDAALVLEKWPSPVTYLGGNIGSTVYTGGILENVPNTNPVRFAYDTFHNSTPGVEQQSWDLLATYYAVLGLDDTFKYGNTEEKGRIKINVNQTKKTDSTAEWSYTLPDVGQQRFLDFKNSSSNVILARRVDDLLVYNQKQLLG